MVVRAVVVMVVWSVVSSVVLLPGEAEVAEEAEDVVLRVKGGVVAEVCGPTGVGSVGNTVGYTGELLETPVDNGTAVPLMGLMSVLLF